MVRLHGAGPQFPALTLRCRRKVLRLRISSWQGRGTRLFAVTTASLGAYADRLTPGGSRLRRARARARPLVPLAARRAGRYDGVLARRRRTSASRPWRCRSRATEVGGGQARADPLTTTRVPVTHPLPREPRPWRLPCTAACGPSDGGGPVRPLAAGANRVRTLAQRVATRVPDAAGEVALDAAQGFATAPAVVVLVVGAVGGGLGVEAAFVDGEAVQGAVEQSDRPRLKRAAAPRRACGHGRLMGRPTVQDRGNRTVAGSMATHRRSRPPVTS
jgi:hypothetical protein